MLSFSSIISWKDFLTIFFPSKLNYIIRSWADSNSNLKIFTRTSWIIFFLANYKSLKSQATVWLPSYYCEEAIYLLRLSKINIFFYDIDKNFFPDFNSIKKLEKNSKPDLIIFCHFFGKNCFHSIFKDLSIKYKAWLVEDATHVLSPENNIGNYGDFIVYSPYKFFPIPFGAIVVSKSSEFNNVFNKKIIRYFLNKIEFKKKNNFYFILKWFLKKLLIKLCLNRIRIQDFTHNEIIHKYQYPAPNIDFFSKKILNRYASQINFEKEKRIKMFYLWIDFLKNNHDLKKLNLDFYEQNNTPYFLIIKNNTTNIENNYNILKSLKIPILTWPNLPSEIKNLNVNNYSYFLRKNLCFIPLHYQPDRLAKKFTYKNSKMNNLFDIKKFKNKISEKNRWKKLYEVVEDANILQSWEYGQSQKEFFKTEIERFVVTDKNNHILAIAQVLIKRFYIFNVYKINRGPLFIKNISEEKKIEIIEKFIFHIKNLTRFNYLSFSPNLELKNNSILLNAKKKYLFKGKSWKSFVLDLKQSEIDLKKNLKSNWRNQLNNSLKHNICIKQESNICNAKKLIMLNEKESHIKKFKTIPKNLLLKYFSYRNYKIFNAYLKNELISSVCIATHFPSSTYLMGWSSKDARKMNATNLLIWNSILYLRKNNFKTFDLGGYDKDVSEGIYNFKAGIGAKNYELIGNLANYNFL